MISFHHLSQWAEPDGDNDALADIRLETRLLLAAYAKSQRKLRATESVLWMADQYVNGHAIPETGEEQEELAKVMEIIKS